MHTASAQSAALPKGLLAGRAALFLDLDDTIISYTAATADVWPDVFAMAGRTGVSREEVSAAYSAIFKPMWGDPERQRAQRVDMRGTWRFIMRECFRKFRIAVSDARLDELTEEFASRLVRSVALLPGAYDALQRIRAAGVRLALLTNGDPRIQRAKLAHCNLAECFDLLVIEGEFGIGKPDPSVYRHALERLGCSPGDVLMAGDNLEFDVLAPTRLGIASVWVSRRGVLPPKCDPQPLGVVRSIAELLPG